MYRHNLSRRLEISLRNKKGRKLRKRRENVACETILFREGPRHLRLDDPRLCHRSARQDAAGQRAPCAAARGHGRVCPPRAPLALEHIETIIANPLHWDTELAASLARLAHDKTAGNPFFSFFSAGVEGA
jgi:hypothetical protein